MTVEEVRCSDALCRKLDEIQSTIGKKHSEDKRLMTGMPLIDELGGLVRGDLTVICGASGSAKSAVARGLAHSISERTEEHVLLVPLQDGSLESTVLRLMAIEAGMPLAGLDSAEMSKEARLDAIDAIDGLRRHNLDIEVQDGLNLTPMLFEAAMRSFEDDLDRRETPARKSRGILDDELPGSGAIIVDTMSMLSDVNDLRDAVRGLRSLAWGSGVCVVATVGLVSLEELADAACVIRLDAGEIDCERQIQEIEAVVLKDGTCAAARRKSRAQLDLSTLKVLEA